MTKAQKIYLWTATIGVAALTLWNILLQQQVNHEEDHGPMVCNALADYYGSTQARPAMILECV